MITVCLYGGLRECGRRFDLQVASPAEAVHALMVQIPALRKKLMKGFYQVRFGRRDWSEAELKSSFGETAEASCILFHASRGLVRTAASFRRSSGWLLLWSVLTLLSHGRFSLVLVWLSAGWRKC